MSNSWFPGLLFALFIAVKAGGTSLAAWSWWWLLMPIVPDIAFVLTKMGVGL